MLGVPEVSRLTGRSPARVRSWRRTKAQGGTDGLIPAEPLAAIWIASERGDTGLDRDDLSPRPLGEVSAFDHTNHPEPSDGASSV